MKREVIHPDDFLSLRKRFLNACRYSAAVALEGYYGNIVGMLKERIRSSYTLYSQF